MNEKQLEIMKSREGFIAALDQSGGSTPKALKLYGISEDTYNGEEEMFNLVHEMRTRIITSPEFNNQAIIGAILFKETMDRTIEGKLTADYLWEEKKILPFLKVDQGLRAEEDGVQLMKPLTGLDDLLKRAVERNIFGTKMRSVIKSANPIGIKKVIDQQFEVGIQIAKMGLVPILEPEIDIHSADKEESEKLMLEEIKEHLKTLAGKYELMFKVSIPTKAGFYSELMKMPGVVRVVALSGGYSREESCLKLAENPGLIASFSRALSEGLNKQQSDDEFNEMLKSSIEKIYEASIK
ncbi:MAG TPA: fructose bisphosphate aldolase [Candidatus Dorea intestinavium]|nr:fructose bisphosphate aldolase [Candidatus Dorea intestinavium]